MLMHIDYHAMLNRDGEDAPQNYVAGTARAMLANRVSYFLFVATKASAILDDGDFTVAKKMLHGPQISFVFTGQGAQWSQMGKGLLTFPLARAIIQELDEVLQSQAAPPSWSLQAELCEPRSAEHLRQPEFSQPPLTAL